MALNFPSSPTTNDTYSFGDKVWRYNGYGWGLLGIKAGNYNSRSYTGNGVANVFAVTSGVTANSLIVSENGVVQEPIVDYNVTNTTLTFTTAPANGVKVIIHELGFPEANGTSTSASSAEPTIHPFMLAGM